MSSPAQILLIANPAAKNGTCGRHVDAVAAQLSSALGEGAVDVTLTEAPRHAVSIARAARGYRAIVALGGDGLASEVASGLLARDDYAGAASAAAGGSAAAGNSAAAGGSSAAASSTRPALGVLPCGSGNDYARAIGMPFKLDRAVSTLLDCLATGARPTDVGTVNGTHFIETLSFGVDAAIALDTVTRRERTGKSGTALYLQSGLDQLLHHLDEHAYRAEFAGCSGADGRGTLPNLCQESHSVHLPNLCQKSHFVHRASLRSLDEQNGISDTWRGEGRSITFAVQVGPYYGGGFMICPDAVLDDGLLDVCISHPPLSVARAVWIFLRAKSGSHTGYPQVEMLRSHAMHIEFDREPPTQADGEALHARTFDIGIERGALDVLRV